MVPAHLYRAPQEIVNQDIRHVGFPSERSRLHRDLTLWSINRDEADCLGSVYAQWSTSALVSRNALQHRHTL
ncbi:hypothetical protein CBOM_08061 [Ceraceosorus bombacis]|uniref:Uncharacterized protein n=1 Tax=Ceraceosorus bombacis TaxID=401625 RepID=A0A0P1BRP0_9BASI|nr:hypothetical protein CBOM_08061 [Ceraceosorus bombacis]